MRVELWRWLRGQPTLRRLYGSRLLGEVMRWASNWLVPGDRRSLIRVGGGLGKGLEFHLYPRWEWPVWNGTYEAEVEAALDELLKPGVVFYDIGGGMGFYTCCAARRGARVFVFEPDLANADCLEAHLRMNALIQRVTVERKVVFSHSGTVRLIVPALRHSHGNAVVGDTGELMAISTTLDDYCLHHPPPDVCKLDVEGAESNVFRGAENLLEKTRPVFLCEVHDEANAKFIEDCLARKHYFLEWLSKQQEFPKHLKAWPKSASGLHAVSE